jgi:ParB family chromosome partitioning protein
VQLRTVNVDLLDVSAFGNDRTYFEPDALSRLAADIKQNGQISPVIVRAKGDRYEIVAGESRTRAIRQLGWQTITVDVREMSDDDLEAFMFSENEVRTDLDPVDQGRAYLRRADAHDWDISTLVAKVGRSRRYVEDRLCLLALADDVAHLVRTKQLPINRGVLISSLEASGQREAVRHADLPTEAFRRLVSKLQAAQDQTSMFDAFTQEEYSELAGKYVTDIETELKDEATESALIGPSELAELLGVKPGTVRQWRARGQLPKPAQTFRHGNGKGAEFCVWKTCDILNWAAAR